MGKVVKEAEPQPDEGWEEFETAVIDTSRVKTGGFGGGPRWVPNPKFMEWLKNKVETNGIVILDIDNPRIKEALGLPNHYTKAGAMEHPGWFSGLMHRRNPIFNKYGLKLGTVTVTDAEGAVIGKTLKVTRA